MFLSDILYVNFEHTPVLSKVLMYNDKNNVKVLVQFRKKVLIDWLYFPLTFCNIV